MTKDQLRERARKAVAAGKYPNEHAYYKALVHMVGPGSEDYYDWKRPASELMLETEPPPLPPIVRPWLKKTKKMP
jgi:hypothetical protein